MPTRGQLAPAPFVLAPAGQRCASLGADLVSLAGVYAFVAERQDFPPEVLACRWDGLPGCIDGAMAKITTAARDLRVTLDRDFSSIEDGNSVLRLWGRDSREPLESGLVGHTDSQRRLLAILAYVRAVRGDGADRAARLAKRALERPYVDADVATLSALMAAAVALGVAGHTSASEAALGGMFEHARRMGYPAAAAACRAQRGVQRSWRGALPEALEDLQAALEASRGREWEALIDDGRSHLLRVQLERGRVDLAKRALDAWCATGPLPDTAFGHRLLIERGRLRFAQGRFGEAAADLESARRRLGGAARGPMFEWRTTAALAHYQLGARERALELARQGLALAERWGAPRQLGVASTTLGAIEGGRTGIERVLRGVEVLDASPALLERARARITLGALLRRRGDDRGAHVQLRTGMEIAVGCGAMGLAHVAEREIAAGGGRRCRRAAPQRPEPLTPSEHRVASLAADGLSNPDIARALFITRKTVEMHLGRAYRKLGIGTRRELRAALGRIQGSHRAAAPDLTVPANG